MKTKWGKGVTLVEVVGILAIIILLIGLLMPCHYNREPARQKVCGKSLLSIGRGVTQRLLEISEKTASMLPIIADPNETGKNPSVKISKFLSTDDPNLPVEELGGRGNINAMQNFWPLIVRSLCQENHFQCPSDVGYKSRKTFLNGDHDAEDKKYGWTSMRNFSFGVQWCYPDANNLTPCAPASCRSDEWDVFMADRNPGGAVSEIIKPSNHPKNGMNVLYRGGGVEFYAKTTDSRTKNYNDDIYVNHIGLIAPPTAQQHPSGDFDTIIVPAYAGDANTGRSE